MPVRRPSLPRSAAFALLLAVVLAAAALAGPSTGTQPAAPAKDYETVSLLGAKLVSPAPDPAAVERHRAAAADFERDPSEENTVWLGRRAAYIGRYREAIAVFSRGLERFPDSYRLLRHRGHRYITLREFVRAKADFERAAALVRGRPLEVEADGLPNAAGIPTSNTQFNIFYHLGLARFLMGDRAGAEAAYRECLAWSKNDDSIAAVTDWLYLTLRRAGKADEAARVLAAVKPRPKIIENGAYFHRLRMYKGELSPEGLLSPKPGESEAERKASFAIYAYGLAQRALWEGDKATAWARLEAIVRTTAWAAFAHIAAEADLARLELETPDLSSPESTLRTWTVFWNLYDLDAADCLFAAGEGTSYYSSEKAGLIAGREALAAHHRGFGFVPGGAAKDSRLWLENVRVRLFGPSAWATADWLFDRDAASDVPPQRGPVTFVLVRDGEADAWRIAHAHFANDPGAK
jgi:tetratricopeptide (TPR) repeat protein